MALEKVDKLTDSNEEAFAIQLLGDGLILLKRAGLWLKVRNGKQG